MMLLEKILIPFKIFHKSITFVTNLVLLSFVYFLGIGPTSLIGKIMKKPFLKLKEEKESYWEDREKLNEGRMF